MKNAAEIGRWGEQVVVDRLRAEGCLIMERNWRCGRYEIDIIALDRREDCVRFVEVKTRSAGSWGSAESAITGTKLRALMHGASAFMAMQGIDREFRFDLAAVEYAPDGRCEVRITENIL